MVIVAIEGYFARSPIHVFRHIKTVCKRRFPEAEFYVEREPDCKLWDLDQFHRMNSFTPRVVTKHDTGKPLLLLGHSMGGPVALAVAAQCQHSEVLGVGTIFSPLNALWGLYPKMLKVPRDLKVPVVSFSTWPDKFLITERRARYKKGVAHKHFEGYTHKMSLLNEPQLSEEIVELLIQALNLTPERP